MAYKGDTDAKKWARLEAYLTALEVLGSKRFRAGLHLCLAGPTASDASVLAGLGVPVGQVVAVERDAETAAAARSRFPDLRVVQRDVLDHLSAERRYDTVNLDFCAQLLESNLNTVALAVTEGVKRDGVLAVTLLAGREQEAHSADIFDAVGRVSAQMQRAFKAMTRERREYWKPMLPALSRFWVLQHELVTRTRGSGRVPVPLALYFYRSRHEGEQKGMPMCVYVAQVKWCPRTSGDAELSAMLAREPEFYFIDPTSVVLGRRAQQLEREGYDPCLLFDVTKRGLAAWKAHATRRDG